MFVYFLLTCFHNSILIQEQPDDFSPLECISEIISLPNKIEIPLLLLIVMAKTQIFIGVFVLCYLIHQNIKQKKPFVYAISIIVIALMFFSIKKIII